MFLKSIILSPSIKHFGDTKNLTAISVNYELLSTIMIIMHYISYTCTGGILRIRFLLR